MELGNRSKCFRGEMMCVVIYGNEEPLKPNKYLELFSGITFPKPKEKYSLSEISGIEKSLGEFQLSRSYF